MKLLVYSVVLGFALAASAQAGAQLPLVFEANHGQAAPEIRFQAHAAGTDVAITDHVVRLGKHLQLRPRGGRATRAVAEDLLSGRKNYIRGTNPKDWITEVALSRAVRSPEVWENIDLRWHSRGNQLEYDVLVAPGGAPAKAQFVFEGASPKLQPNGSLTTGTLHWDRPVAFQTIAGKRMPVAARYTLAKDGTVGFAVGRYDHSKPLVIDPVLRSSGFLGGAGEESVFGVATNASGDAFVMGSSSSGGAGRRDLFVSRISATGALVYTTYIGGSDNEGASDMGGIAVDAGGNAYITSDSNSRNFPTAAGVFSTEPQARVNTVVAKLDASGHFVWGTYYGGAQDEAAAGIAINADGRVVIIGQTNSPDLPTTQYPIASTPGYRLPSRTDIDAFVAIFTPTGLLEMGTYLGGTNFDFASSVAFSPTGRLYVTGGTYSSDFPIVLPAGATHNGLGGGSDSFLIAFNPDWTVRYINRMGGSSEDQSKYGGSVTVDANDNATVVGQTTSTNFPTLLAYQATNQGGGDAFAYQLGPNGLRNWATYLGGAGLDNARAAAVDEAGFIYITGSSASANFPLSGAFFSNPGGFVARLTPQGMLIGSSFLDRQLGASGIATIPGAQGDVYVVGSTSSTTMPQVRPFQAAFGGGFTDGFLDRIHFDAVDVEVTQTAAPYVYYSGDVATFTIQVTNNGIDPASNVVLTDTVSGTELADPDNHTTLAIVSATSTQGTVGVSGRVVTVNLGAMAPGATATVRVSVRMTVDTADLAVFSRAVATVTPGDVRPANNTSGTSLLTHVDTRPHLDNLSPDLVPAGGPAFLLTVNGRGFVPGVEVLINGLPRPTTYVTTNRVTATVLASDIATAGSAQVRVRLGSTPSEPLVLLIGTPRINFTATAAHRTPSGWRVTVRITNTGSADAPGLRVTGGTLATRATTTALPQLVGLLPNTGGAVTVDLDFPEAAGTSGATVAFRLNGTYSGGTFGGTALVRLP